MFQRILVPLDGSERAEQALPVASLLAQASEGTLILANVVNLALEAIAYGGGDISFPPDVTENAIIDHQAYLDRLIEQIHLPGSIATEKQVVVGNPAAEILALAQEQQIDLIVMTSHCYSGIKQWLRGNVAERVAHLAPTPVLILRDREPFHIHIHADGTHVVRALVPLDLLAHAQDAILPVAQLVTALSSPGMGKLHLLQMLVIPEDASETEKETLLHEAETHLDAIGQQVRKTLRAQIGPILLPKVTWSISTDSDIAEGIARVAENGEETVASGRVKRCDLIAMTTRRQRGSQPWVIGSITDRVLRATKLPLLIVRPAEILAKEARQRTDHAPASV